MINGEHNVKPDSPVAILGEPARDDVPLEACRTFGVDQNDG